MINKLLGKSNDWIYLIFRLLVGFMFMVHGGQKLFGWFIAIDASQIGISELLFNTAGIIEFFGGLAIFLGLFTRLIALITALEMIIVYIIVHIPINILPLLNGGEPAALFFASFLIFFASFLILLIYGSGRISLDKALFKKELF